MCVLTTSNLQSWSDGREEEYVAIHVGHVHAGELKGLMP